MIFYFILYLSLMYHSILIKFKRIQYFFYLNICLINLITIRLTFIIKNYTYFFSYSNLFTSAFKF